MFSPQLCGCTRDCKKSRALPRGSIQTLSFRSRRESQWEPCWGVGVGLRGRVFSFIMPGFGDNQCVMKTSSLPSSEDIECDVNMQLCLTQNTPRHTDLRHTDLWVVCFRSQHLPGKSHSCQWERDHGDCSPLFSSVHTTDEQMVLMRLHCGTGASGSDLYLLLFLKSPEITRWHNR